MRISDWSSDVCSSDLLRAGGGERRDPAALARPLETEARSASARHPARFGERGDGIVGEQRKDLRLFVARCAGAALVIDERADARGGKHTLSTIGRHRGRKLWHVEPSDERDGGSTGGHHKPGGPAGDGKTDVE